MSAGEFSVAQYFKTGDYDYEIRFVDMKTAVNVFAFLCTNVAAQVGLTQRVIITDGDDFVNAEWQFGQGVTFPPELKNIDLTKRKKHA